MSFGKRLKQCREEKGLTQQEVAIVIETTHGMVGRYERDEVIPSIEVAINLGKALDVSVAFLIGESDVKKQNELSFILSKADIDLLPEVERRALLVVVNRFVLGVRKDVSQTD
ncbi:MAG: helix-turn-helix transcriptional regulator [Cytophagales bacterium]|nr:helix-turn-helix transcriptional regulator [Cytophagales bacterium]MCA6370768.1 helix-turn-helix transcriptional regulator [Cytophagales bacterium]MCA6385930.1 helix-turn-helix transcriptional regulator [Cytophagales bacterium]